MGKLTKANRTRLDKLATYLEGLPEGYRHFRMNDYVSGVRDEAKEAAYARKNGGVTECGTAACAAGHGPAAGILMPRRLVTNKWGEWEINWHAYTGMFVGVEDDGEPVGHLFEWLFGGHWVGVDNHHFGAAARIRYLLDKGAPPGSFFGYAKRAHRSAYAPYRIDAKARADA